MWQAVEAASNCITLLNCVRKHSLHDAKRKGQPHKLVGRGARGAAAATATAPRHTTGALPEPASSALLTVHCRHYLLPLLPARPSAARSPGLAALQAGPHCGQLRGCSHSHCVTKPLPEPLRPLLPGGSALAWVSAGVGSASEACSCPLHRLVTGPDLPQAAQPLQRVQQPDPCCQRMPAHSMELREPKSLQSIAIVPCIVVQ